MNIENLITKNRSYRRFDASYKIDYKVITKLVNLARLSASARNLQPLKYYLAHDKDVNDIIFKHLSWAGYLTNWDGPSEGERPTGYIIILKDTTIAKNTFCDEGIASQSILLGAVEMGLGGCIIGSVKKDKLSDELHLPKHLEILQVLAIGKPTETVVIEDIQEDNIKYWRDEKDTHHVPKRKLSDIIVNI